MRSATNISGRTTVEAQRLTTWGKVFFSDGNPLWMDSVQDDDPGAGDWSIVDHYYCDQDLRLTELARTINVLPGDRSVASVYAIAGGRARPVMTTTAELRTGKPAVLPDDGWLPDLPIVSDAKAFPFVALLRRPSAPTHALSCVKANRTKDRSSG